MDYQPTCVRDLIARLNKDVYLPAIQREFVWKPDRIERLFDSIMGDFPIGSFLFWRLKEENKDQWPIYEFIREYDREDPHNDRASLKGVNKDVTLVLDGQQRITSLFIGLRGSYRYFYYRWRKETLYLNLLKAPVPNEDDPEELTYQFAFREDAIPAGSAPQLWYEVGRILDHDDAEDSRESLEPALAGLDDGRKANARKLVGRLHARVHTKWIGNYYEEKSQDYDKVLQVFVRANSGGMPLEYSDLLLATATAQWETLDARAEIHDFTDALNEIGTGYGFGKDFVLKACLYLTDNLPIQYSVRNFTKQNLARIEENWGAIKSALLTTVRLISRFGFNKKNVVAPIALLPIALFIKRRRNTAFDTSSEMADAEAQRAIRRWFVFATLKNTFSASTDTILTRLREVLNGYAPTDFFPDAALYEALGIEPTLNDAEVARMLGSAYQGKYTNLVLALFYPDRDWKDAVFHEDHIFPQTAFQPGKLKKHGFDDATIAAYASSYNFLPNLQLLTDSENLAKNATPFSQWLATRDPAFRARHLIPDLASYELADFGAFIAARTRLIATALHKETGAEPRLTETSDGR